MNSPQSPEDSYRCRDCKTVFTTSTARKRRETSVTEFWGERRYVIDEYDGCPVCGSESFEDFVPCRSCGVSEAGAGIDDCEACWAAAQSVA